MAIRLWIRLVLSLFPFFQIFEWRFFVKTTGIFPLVLLPQTNFRAIIFLTLSFVFSFFLSLCVSLSLFPSLSLSLSLCFSLPRSVCVCVSSSLFLLFPPFLSLYLVFLSSVSLSLFNSLFFYSQIQWSRKPVEQIVTPRNGRPRQNTPRASNRLNWKNQTAFVCPPSNNHRLRFIL